MTNYHWVLFDLDGTLTDPKLGITKSVQYALKKLEIIETDLDKLETFIGPPLQESFAKYYSFDNERTNLAVEFYREYFKQTGMFENEIYAGIPELLKKLKNEDRILTVATSKPTEFSEQILDYFGIRQYFDLVVGSNLDGTRTSKTEIIGYVLDKYKGIDKKAAIMVGDREHDIIGANNSGIPSIGVTYGYGSKDKLTSAGPTYIADTIEDLESILIQRTH